MNELQAEFDSGFASSLYFLVRNSVAMISSSFGYVNYNPANYYQYPIGGVTEQGHSGYYLGNLPAGSPADVYSVILKLISGSSPAESDLSVGEGTLYWDGFKPIPPPPGPPTETGFYPNSAAEVMAQLLIELGQGITPDTSGAIIPNGVWPVYSTNEPSVPDDVITCYDITDRPDIRSMVDGKESSHYGVQIRIRAIDHPTAYQKAKDIREALLTQVGGVAGAINVVIGLNNYLIHSVNNVRYPLALGTDVSRSKRSLFTVNCTMALEIA